MFPTSHNFFGDVQRNYLSSPQYTQSSTSDNYDSQNEYDHTDYNRDPQYYNTNYYSDDNRDTKSQKYTDHAKSHYFSPNYNTELFSILIRSIEQAKTCEKERTWEHLDYTGFMSRQGRSFSDKNKKLYLSPPQFVDLRPESFIPEALSLLRSAQVPSDYLQQFMEFSGSLALLFPAVDHKGSRYSHLYDKLIIPKNISSSGQVPSPGPALDEIENDFLVKLLKWLHSANFVPLRKEEYEFATRRENSVFLGVKQQIVFDELDPRLLRRLYDHNHKSREQPPDFAHYCLVFWRGFGHERKNGLYILEKLDYWISSVFHQIGDLFKSSERANELREEWPLESTRRLERISVGDHVDVGLGFDTLTKEVEIQEPYFEEMILVYRRKTSDSKDQNTEQIRLERYNHLPLNRLLSALPSREEGMNWADVLWIILTVFWFLSMASRIITLLFQRQSENNLLETLVTCGVTLLMPLLLRQISRLVFSFRAGSRAKLASGETLRVNSVEWSGKGVVEYLQRSAWNQQTILCLVIYFVLWSVDLMRFRDSPGLSLSELATTTELLLREKFGLDVEFDVLHAVKELSEANVLNEIDGKYVVLLPTEAKEKVDQMIFYQSQQAYAKLLD